MDFVITCIAYVGAWGLKFGAKFIDESIGILDTQYYFLALAILAPTMILLYSFFGLYSTKRTHGYKTEMFSIIKADVVGGGIFILVLFLFHLDDFSRVLIALFYGISFILEFVFRVLLRTTLRKIRKKGFNQKHIVLVGYSKAGEGYINRIIASPQWGYNIVGILDDNMEIGSKYKNIPVIGRVEDIESIISGNELDEIVITLGLSEYSKLAGTVSACEKSGIHTKFVPDYNNLIPTRPYIEDVQGLAVVNIRRNPLENSSVNKFIKRFSDILGSLLAIIIFSPVMLVCVIGIKCSSRGKIIFKQERVGRHSKNFMMYKFRSMKEIPPEMVDKGWTVKDDPRVTGFGKFIRKTSIDELPQLFNVLKGDMSLIGPRPERPVFVEQFKEEIPRYMVKHQVRPGMTGWAQVHGYRGDTSITKRIEYDLYYIENWSVILDIKIFVRTIFEGFINKNAY